MKKYLLIALTLSISTQVDAGYMSKADILDCGKSGKTFYLQKISCDKNYSDCHQVPKNYHCETYSELDTEVDDHTNPKYTKNEVELCSDESSCQLILDNKVCADSDEVAYISEDYSQAYCSKWDGYNKMTIKKIREDSGKKTSYDAAKLAVKNDKKGKKDFVKALKNSNWASLNDSQKNKVIKYLLRNIN